MTIRPWAWCLLAPALVGCATIGTGQPTVHEADATTARREVPLDRLALNVHQSGVSLTVSAVALCDQMVQRDVEVTKTYELVNQTPGVDYLAAAAAGALIVAGVVVLADSSAVAQRDETSQDHSPIGPGGAQAIGGSLLAAGGLTFVIPIADGVRASGTRQDQAVESRPETVERSGVRCGPFPGVRVGFSFDEEIVTLGTTDANGTVVSDLAKELQGKDVVSGLTKVNLVATTPSGHMEALLTNIDLAPVYAAHESAAWRIARPACTNAMFLKDCTPLRDYVRTYLQGVHFAEADRILEEQIPKLIALEAEQAYQRLDIPSCTTGSKEQTADDGDQACASLGTFVSGYPDGPRAEEVRAAMEEGRLRIAKLREVEEAKAQREERQAAKEAEKTRVSAPRFQGQVGQVWKAGGFSAFIHKNRFKIVFVEMWIPEGEFDGDEDGLSFFVLWEHCSGLTRGEKPNMTKCTGTEYNIASNPEVTESGLFYSRGVYKLEGYFSVSGFDGPHQGLMGTTLKPLRVEDVR